MKICWHPYEKNRETDEKRPAKCYSQDDFMVLSARLPLCNVFCIALSGCNKRAKEVKRLPGYPDKITQLYCPSCDTINALLDGYEVAKDFPVDSRCGDCCVHLRLHVVRRIPQGEQLTFLHGAEGSLLKQPKRYM